jgi:hypothetical protein
MIREMGGGGGTPSSLRKITDTQQLAIVAANFIFAGKSTGSQTHRARIPELRFNIIKTP